MPMTSIASASSLSVDLCIGLPPHFSPPDGSKAAAILNRDDVSLKRHPDPIPCWSMILSESKVSEAKTGSHFFWIMF
jgi:hypothetical protein